MGVIFSSQIPANSAWEYTHKELPDDSTLYRANMAVLISTVAGISTAFTPIGRGLSTSILANIMLYIIIALIASRADFGELTQAPNIY